MSPVERQRFFSERRRAEDKNKDATIGDVLVQMSSLEHSIRTEFEGMFKNLCNKLDVVVDEDDKTSVDEIMAEIQAMNEHITATKQEVAALKPVDDANTTIVIATEELSEVVRSTEAAANTILENTENLDQIVTDMRGKISEGDPDGIGPSIDKLEFISMELLTACSFQDITGQRITKVVNSLNFIEERLEKMIDIWRIEHGTANPQEMALPKDDQRADKDLLHGPQNTGMSQNDIDSLFD
jgi:chemotaxis regulatin CheY-phosphate phosphatase CheZ